MRLGSARSPSKCSSPIFRTPTWPASKRGRCKQCLLRLIRPDPSLITSLTKRGSTDKIFSRPTIHQIGYDFMKATPIRSRTMPSNEDVLNQVRSLLESPGDDLSAGLIKELLVGMLRLHDAHLEPL